MGSFSWDSVFCSATVAAFQCQSNHAMNCDNSPKPKRCHGSVLKAKRNIFLIHTDGGSQILKQWLYFIA